MNSSIALQRLSKKFADLNFGSIEADSIHRVLQAIAGLPFGQGKTFDLQREDAETHLRNSLLALRKTISFLQQEALIPHVGVLPYQSLLVVLAKFFHLHPECHPISRVRLRRWVWRASLREDLSGDATRYVRALEGSEHDAITALLALQEERTQVDDYKLVSQLSRRAAKARLEYCALLALRPRWLDSGEVIPIENILDGEELSGFQWIRGTQEAESEYKKSLAAKVAYPNVVGVRELLDAQDVAVLASHGINEQVLQAAHKQGVPGFLAARHEYLQRWTQRFFARMAEWGCSDAPPVFSLRVREGSDAGVTR